METELRRSPCRPAVDTLKTTIKCQSTALLSTAIYYSKFPFFWNTSAFSCPVLCLNDKVFLSIACSLYRVFCYLRLFSWWNFKRCMCVWWSSWLLASCWEVCWNPRVIISGHTASAERRGRNSVGVCWFIGGVSDQQLTDRLHSVCSFICVLLSCIYNCIIFKWNKWYICITKILMFCLCLFIELLRN